MMNIRPFDLTIFIRPNIDCKILIYVHIPVLLEVAGTSGKKTEHGVVRRLNGFMKAVAKIDAS